MSIKELSQEECRTALARARVGRLGCSREDQPYVVPINIVYEQDYIYCFSTLGQKIHWMRANPKVCLQWDEITTGGAWVSVIADGLYQELREPQFEHERAHARRLLDREHHWWLNALAERQLKSHNELIAPMFFRIHIESLSGLESSDAETRS